jgi:hypothetical protein
MRSALAMAAGAAALCFGLHSSADTNAKGIDPQAIVPTSEADAAVASIEGVARRVRAVLRRARTRGTSEQIACANEGLSRVDVALRNAREHARLSREAAAKGDSSSVRRELALLRVCAETARGAEGATDSCWTDAQTRDDTSVRVIVDSR